MIAFSAMLAEWLGRNAYSTADAANALGCPVVTFRGWLAGRSEPAYFAMCAVTRQMREGHDPLTDVRMTSAEFASALKEWRVQHRFTVSAEDVWGLITGEIQALHESYVFVNKTVPAKQPRGRIFTPPQAIQNRPMSCIVSSAVWPPMSVTLRPEHSDSNTTQP